jgi:hypothetical protein
VEGHEENEDKLHTSSPRATCDGEEGSHEELMKIPHKVFETFSLLKQEKSNRSLTIEIIIDLVIELVEMTRIYRVNE